MKHEHDEQRARELHVRLGHLFVVHFRRAKSAARRRGAQFFASEKLG